MMMKRIDLTFKLNQELKGKSPDGRNAKTKVTKEGDRFICIQSALKQGEKSTKIVREFQGDEVIQTSTIIGSDLVCTQVFKKLVPKTSAELSRRYRAKMKLKKHRF